MLTNNEFKIIGDKIIESKMVGLLENLYCRWQDEREYEDFAEYEKVIKREFVSLEIKGTTFVKATKRPFGFTFIADYPKPIFFGIKGNKFIMQVV